MEAGGNREIMHPSRNDTLRIWALADFHLGNRGCAKDRLKADIEAIRTEPNSFWFGLGDYADYIGLNDPRLDLDVLDEAVVPHLRDLQDLGHCLTVAVRDLLKPIAHKCLGLGIGNHDWQYNRRNQQSGNHAWLCQELGATNLFYEALTRVSFLRTSHCPLPILLHKSQKSRDRHTDTHTVGSYLIHTWHGGGRAGTKGGKVNAMERQIKRATADIAFMGHLHDTIAMPMVEMNLSRDGKTIIERRRGSILTGSYLRGYMHGQVNYTELTGLPPTPLGAVWVDITPETREVRTEVRM